MSNGPVVPDERSLFLDAIEIASMEERSSYLDAACRGDRRLRAEVEALLDAHGRSLGLLDAADWGPAGELPGSSVGTYRLLEAIGEGGMGTVYLAEQTHPVRRKVALKLIKPGMDTNQVIARFEAERQALALMDHPNIAKVHDAGTTDSGRPFFVMELVDGISITDYCDREQLPIRERLDLFVLVCRAVQHAHQKGVIHRDLKPTNVLVSTHDGVPVPKVIDFGVAKATGGSLTERTLFTGFHQFIGTPLYVSPEQADLSGVDVDTRSDIYSLGVLLYELLTGTTPFDSETLRQAAFDEMRRIIREEEPPKPSTRVRSLGERLSTVSARRKSDPKRLGSVIEGELDWVVMKALEKDRRRRYETASDFAADVMNYLADRPVVAVPPSAWYRFGKFARRNRAALSTATLVVLTLVGGIATSLRQAARATAAEHRTASALAGAEGNLLLARKAVDELYDEVAARWLMTDLIRLAPLPRPFLERALPFYRIFADTDSIDPSSGQAHRRVGEILLQLERLDEAEVSLRRAEAIFRALGDADPRNADHIRDLAGCYAREAEIKFDASLHRKAIVLREELVRRSPDVAPFRRELAASLHALADGQPLSISGRFSVYDHLDRARDLRERLSADDPDDPTLLSDLGATYRSLGRSRAKANRSAESIAFSRQALAIHEGLVARYPTRSQFRVQQGWDCTILADSLLKAREYAETLRVAKQGATNFEGLANEYPDLRFYRQLHSRNLATLATALFLTSRQVEAEQAIRRIERLEDDMGINFWLTEVARGLVRRDARPACPPARAVDLTTRALSFLPDTAETRHVLGIAHYRAGNWDASIAELLRANELGRDKRLAFNGFFLAMAYHRKGEGQSARSWYERSAAWADVNVPDDPVATSYREEARDILSVVSPDRSRPEARSEGDRPPN